MKILKSGIELEPSELEKVKGGLCSCGCDIGYNGMRIVVAGEENGSCYCASVCLGDETVKQANFYDDFHGAYIQLNPPL